MQPNTHGSKTIDDSLRLSQREEEPGVAMPAKGVNIETVQPPPSGLSSAVTDGYVSFSESGSSSSVQDKNPVASHHTVHAAGHAPRDTQNGYGNASVAGGRNPNKALEGVCIGKQRHISSTDSDGSDKWDFGDDSDGEEGSVKPTLMERKRGEELTPGDKEATTPGRGSETHCTTDDATGEPQVRVAIDRLGRRGNVPKRYGSVPLARILGA